MKFSEMNQKQQKATINIKYAAYDLIGGLENTMQDNAPDSKEYENAKAELADHNGLVRSIYHNSINCIYREGIMDCSSFAARELKDIRFCGKEFLMMVVEARVKHEGY